MRRTANIPFFIDHCVPESVPVFLETKGYAVTRLRRELPPDSPDPLVAAVCEKNGAVLVSLDGDFQKIAPRISIGRLRFKRLSRIWLRCHPVGCVERLGIALRFIESEWRLAQKSADKRMILQIGDSFIRSDR